MEGFMAKVPFHLRQAVHFRTSHCDGCAPLRSQRMTRHSVVEDDQGGHVAVCHGCGNITKATVHRGVEKIGGVVRRLAVAAAGPSC
jgi:uncharacterized Zn finger protein